MSSMSSCGRRTPASSSSPASGERRPAASTTRSADSTSPSAVQTPRDPRDGDAVAVDEDAVDGDATADGQAGRGGGEPGDDALDDRTASGEHVEALVAVEHAAADRRRHLGEHVVAQAVRRGRVPRQARGAPLRSSGGTAARTGGPGGTGGHRGATIVTSSRRDRPAPAPDPARGASPDGRRRASRMPVSWPIRPPPRTTMWSVRRVVEVERGRIVPLSPGRRDPS